MLYIQIQRVATHRWQIVISFQIQLTGKTGIPRVSLSKEIKAFMECKNHPSIPAIDRCAGCAEPFCGDCLITIGGKKYCGACKVLAVQGQPVIVEEATIPCKEADEALKYA